MSKIIIKNLTPVHVGSGTKLSYGTEFITYRDSENYDVVGIIDLRKCAELIPAAKLPSWLAALSEKKSIDEVMQAFIPGRNNDLYCRRVDISGCEKVRCTDTLLEQIHDGRGFPYIPGSSIKGAIRTAILASEIKKNLSHYLSAPKITANRAENAIFGDSPNTEWMRFLRVGDAFYGQNYEVVLRTVSLNERENGDYWDKKVQQLVEALAPEDYSSFDLKMDIEQLNFVRSRKGLSIPVLPDGLNSLESLFQIINEHTIQMLDFEIDYWERRQDHDTSGKTDNYLKQIEEIRSSAQKCIPGSCVLRIGYGSGWRFITGDWTRKAVSFKSDIVVNARLRNYNYVQYNFPKTRKVDSFCELFGFVKLTIKKGKTTEV